MKIRSLNVKPRTEPRRYIAGLGSYVDMSPMGIRRTQSTEKETRIDQNWP